MSANYDPAVIQEFADRLYAKAKGLVRNYTILGVILLGLGGGITQEPIAVLLGALLGGVIGYMWGKEKAFAYKLQAQTALCQVKIEANTKVGASET